MLLDLPRAIVCDERARMVHGRCGLKVHLEIDPPAEPKPKPKTTRLAPEDIARIKAALRSGKYLYKSHLIRESGYSRGQVDYVEKVHMRARGKK